MISSIIIPAYNGELLIKLMTRFIWAFNEGEIIIIYDRSIDNAQAVLKKLIAKNSKIKNFLVSSRFLLGNC